MDPDILAEEEYANLRVLDIPEDAQYEDGTTVTKESLLTGDFPKWFEQELLEKDVIDGELLAKIKQVNK